MSEEISQEKMNYVIKCLLRVHDITDSDAVARFRSCLLTTRKQQLIDLIKACQEDM